ncbi:MAG: acyl carrier protein [Candidatus Poribacteria bacterium]
MQDDLDIRIKAIFRNTLQIPSDKIVDESRRGDFEEWDSLGHIMLIDALAKEFNLKISAEEALDMESIQDIKRTIAEQQH